MKRLLMTLVLLLTAGAVVAQSGKVTAKVRDKVWRDWSYRRGGIGKES